MAKGQQVGIVGVVVLAAAIIGFYVWQSRSNNEETLSIEPTAELPAPTPPGTISKSDPSMTRPSATTQSPGAKATGTTNLDLGVNTVLDQTAPAAPVTTPSPSAVATTTSPSTPAATQLKPLSAAELGALASNTSSGTTLLTSSSSPTLGINRPATTTSTGATTSGGYVVRQGDSMWSIAERTLGNGAQWPAIARANPTVDPNSMQPGQRLIIPGAPASTTTVAAATPSAGGRTVVVAEGETLWGIAQREYGDGTLWQVIFEANANQMRNPNDIRSGQRITIPSLSTR